MFKMRRSTKPNSIKQLDLKRRKFLIDVSKFIGGFGAIYALFPFVSSLNPNKKVLRNNQPLKVDVGHLKPGEQMTVKWRGKPIWIIYRTNEQLQELQISNQNLRDPESLTDQQPDYAKNIYRARNPKYLVLVGLCTHLGCSPKLKSNNNSNKQSGFYCPCHGSRFDLSGRVYKGMPAPINLEVPPYYFSSENVIVIGASHA